MKKHADKYTDIMCDYRQYRGLKVVDVPTISYDIYGCQGVYTGEDCVEEWNSNQLSTPYLFYLCRRLLIDLQV